MSTPQSPPSKGQHITPPYQPDQETFPQAARVIALFTDIEAGRHVEQQQPWTEFQLAPGEYAEIQRRITQKKSLSEFVKHKLR
jgi:hypothetical protein